MEKTAHSNLQPRKPRRQARCKADSRREDLGYDAPVLPAQGRHPLPGGGKRAGRGGQVPPPAGSEAADKEYVYELRSRTSAMKIRQAGS